MKFRMVDRISAWEPRRVIRGVKVVSFEEYELREPLGYEPYLPESLILESLFQLANWLVILSTDYEQTCVGAQWDEARFLDTLRPGSRMAMEVAVSGWRDDSVIVDGTVLNGGKTVVAVRRCLAAFVPLADYYDPDDLRVLFSEIHRPDATAQLGATSCPA
jgi:3-hydroxymyristoyl/3-hydroxydecanoyl-(acyl carrier protein) dehydratase